MLLSVQVPSWSSIYLFSIYFLTKTKRFRAPLSVFLSAPLMRAWRSWLIFRCGSAGTRAVTLSIPDPIGLCWQADDSGMMDGYLASHPPCSTRIFLSGPNRTQGVDSTQCLRTFVWIFRILPKNSGAYTVPISPVSTKLEETHYTAEPAGRVIIDSLTSQVK